MQGSASPETELGIFCKQSRCPTTELQSIHLLWWRTSYHLTWCSDPIGLLAIPTIFKLAMFAHGQSSPMVPRAHSCWTLWAPEYHQMPPWSKGAFASFPWVDCSWQQWSPRLCSYCCMRAELKRSLLGCLPERKHRICSRGCPHHRNLSWA